MQHIIDIAGKNTGKLIIQPLGAGQEVGRSCMLVRYDGRTVLFDCGLHHSNKGLSKYPFFDSILDPLSAGAGAVPDAMFITHYHTDHCAALPYFVEQTKDYFHGPIYMTTATKDAYARTMELHQHKEERDFRGQLARSIARTSAVNFYQPVEVNGIRAVAVPAGHVIGACMWVVEIAGVRVLYTGDFSVRNKERHLSGADVAGVGHVDVVICESTHGDQNMLTTEQAEQKVVDFAASVVQKGGKCLLPVVSIGRAQELFLLLRENKHKFRGAELVYLVTNDNCRLFTRHTYFLRDTFQRNTEDKGSPLTENDEENKIEIVDPIKAGEYRDRSTPLIILASPGLLEPGRDYDTNSATLFDAWYNDESNGILLTGLIRKESPAFEVLDQHKYNKMPVRCAHDYVSLSAHSDKEGTLELISKAKPSDVVLVHGRREFGTALARVLTNSLPHSARIHQPENEEPVVVALDRPPARKVLASGVVSAQISNGELIHGFVDGKHLNGGENALTLIVDVAVPHFDVAAVCTALNIPCQEIDGSWCVDGQLWFRPAQGAGSGEGEAENPFGEAEDPFGEAEDPFGEAENPFEESNTSNSGWRTQFVSGTIYEQEFDAIMACVLSQQHTQPVSQIESLLIEKFGGSKQGSSLILWDNTVNYEAGKLAGPAERVEVVQEFIDIWE